jgi:hypothetical protein
MKNDRCIWDEYKSRPKNKTRDRSLQRLSRSRSTSSNKYIAKKPSTKWREGENEKIAELKRLYNNSRSNI